MSRGGEYHFLQSRLRSTNGQHDSDVCASAEERADVVVRISQLAKTPGQFIARQAYPLGASL